MLILVNKDRAENTGCPLSISETNWHFEKQDSIYENLLFQGICDKYFLMTPSRCLYKTLTDGILTGILFTAFVVLSFELNPNKVF